MRQAGRSLPEYFPVRGDGSILDAIKEPERAAEITLQPTRRYDLDAAILFSDIVTPLWATGIGIDIKPGVGPVTENPIRDESDLDRFRPVDPESDLDFQTEAIKLITKELDIPLIGFCGAPFTLATYLIEGKPSKNHTNTKRLMFSNPELWHTLCEKISEVVIASLKAQIDAGVEAVQLFDSWAGILHPVHYQEFVFPHSKRILETVQTTGIPLFHFGTGTSMLLDQFAAAGADVVGVDWKTSLRHARTILGNDYTLQGNLDPSICTAPWPVVEKEVRRILDENAGNPRFIFNLGHGVLPETNPDILARVADFVHEYGQTLLDNS